MGIALFGATGRTGQLVLGHALKRGWPTKALVRSRAKLAPQPGLEVFEGDARDPAALAPVIQGAGAVICALGMHDISVPATDFSDSVKAIVAAMKAQGVRRIVAIASAGALDHPDGGYRNQRGIPDWLKNVSAEHVRNYETLRDSGLDWTLMCPMALVDDIPEGHARWAFDDLPPDAGGETGYADLARTMADLLTDRKSFRKRVGIVSSR